MLQEIERYASADPRFEGVKTFSVLPLTSSSVVGHVAINSKTLHALCVRVCQHARLNVLGVPIGSKGALAGFTYFNENREVLMRTVFAVKQFETGTRHFAYQVTTNGYNASVLLSYPTGPKDNLTTSTNKQMKISETQSSSVSSADGCRSKPVVTVGVDPGLRKLCTTVVNGERQLAVEPTPRWLVRQACRRCARKRKKRRHFKHQRHRDKRRHYEWCLVDGKRIVKILSRKFRHLTDNEKHRVWHENLKACKPGYRIVLANVPMFKTSSFTIFLDNHIPFWKNLEYMLRFSAKHGFHKWRFFL